MAGGFRITLRGHNHTLTISMTLNQLQNKKPFASWDGHVDP
jgi:hypothetical protein